MVNIMKLQTTKLGTLAATGLLVLCNSLNAYAVDTLALPYKPIFNAAQGVESNIFLTIDDSWSMRWEFIYQQDDNLSLPDTEGLPMTDPSNVNGSRIETIVPGWGGNVAPTLDVDDPNDTTWVFYNHRVNKLYYNPEIDYTPWPGTDPDTSRPMYPELVADDLKSIRKHPNDTESTWSSPYKNIVDPTAKNFFQPVYCTWDRDVPDADGNTNGLDEADDHTCIEIKDSAAFTTAMNKRPVSQRRTLAEELLNYGTWMQYYRTRVLAANNALGHIVNDTSNARMGLSFINDSTVPKIALKSNSVAANKHDLLVGVYGNTYDHTTPLRQALARTGNMFKKASSYLSKEEGGECQQNFNIFMTDGYDTQAPPSDFSDEDTGGDSKTDFDGTINESIDHGNYADSPGYTPTSTTLADIAMYFYENDLIPDNILGDKVPTASGYDLAPHQHMVNYAVAFGLTGNLGEDADPTDSGFYWPVPVNGTASSLDDLRHAAYNSRGLYLSADNPKTLLESLSAAVMNITERSSISSAAAVTSSQLTNNSTVYIAEYNSESWRGTITAKNGLLDTTLWDAGEILTNTAANDRTIITYNNTGVAFRWDEDTNVLSDNMKSDLLTNCSIKAIKPDANCTTDAVTAGYTRLNYLRGDRSNESTLYRERKSLLGDIVNSGPIYVQAPSLDYPDVAPFPTDATKTYSAFKATQKNRKPVVYAGANDGMFHAFDASTPTTGETSTAGKEILAYIPSYLSSSEYKKGLHYLTSKQYLHQFYNDLQATVSDVYLGSAWKTILVGGQRAGGRGYFALDVTNPASFSEATAANIALWEFSSQDDADLGYSYSRPQIGMLNDSAKTWVAIFGNGYNSTGTGEAQLFVVKLSGPTGDNGEWVENTDYFKITTGTSTVDSPRAQTNGLATPALADLDGNGTIDRAYAGDLNGKLWVFDLSGELGELSLAYDSPLFETGGPAITAKPILSRHPTQPNSDDNAPNLMVFFGSGKFLVDADIDDTDTVNYFYGVWDNGAREATLTNSNLVEQQWPHTVGAVPTDNAVNYAEGDNGWRIRLQMGGERSITDPAVRGSAIIFNTTVPRSSPCNLAGQGYRYAVNLASGSFPTEPVLDLNNDGTVDDSDMITGDSDFTAVAPLSDFPTNNTFTDDKVASGDQFDPIKELSKAKPGRLSWQELLK